MRSGPILAQNLHCSWNAALGAQTLYALRDIERGEELTISYLPTLERPRAARYVPSPSRGDAGSRTEAAAKRGRVWRCRAVPHRLESRRRAGLGWPAQLPHLVG